MTCATSGRPAAKSASMRRAASSSVVARLDAAAQASSATAHRTRTQRTSATRERRTEDLRGDVDDRNDALVGHARRANDSDDAHDLVVVAVRRGDHAAVVENPVSGFLADEDLDSVGAQAVIEQVEDVALLVECLEQPAQLVH